MIGNRRTLGVVIGSCVLIAAVLGIGGGLAFYKYRSIMVASQQGPPPEMPEAVSIQAAVAVSFSPRVTAIGTVHAPRSITLRNEIAGQVVDVPMRAGGVVEQGQTLVVLDRSVEEAQLQSAKAHQRMARSMLERTRLVAKANASSGNEIDQAEADMTQSDADIARLTAIIAKKTLVAPFRAKAGLVDTHVGQFLSEGTQITTLQGIDDYIHIDFMMPQAVADSVDVGQAVKLLVEPLPLEATVVAIDSQSDRMTRNLMARAKLDQPPAFLQPNDSVKVEVQYGKELNGIAIPAEALRRSPTGAFVYLAKPDQSGGMRATVARVTPGQTVDGAVIVYQGLQAGDQVIVDGSFKLREGVLVAVPQPPASQVATTPNPAPQ